MLLLSNSSLSWYSLHRVFSFAKKAKYEWLELTLSKLQYDLWDPHYIKWLSDAFGIPVLSITAPIKGIDEWTVDRIIEIAEITWAQIVTFFPPHLMDKNTKWFTEHLPKVNKSSHLSVCVQNVESKFIFFIIPEFKNSTLSQLKKITWNASLDIAAIDPSNGTDIMKAQKLLWNSIKQVCLSDRKWTQTWILPGKAWWWISHLPIESFFMKLKTVWYSGHITIRLRQAELWAGNEDLVLQNLEFAKKYYLKHFVDFE